MLDPEQDLAAIEQKRKRVVADKQKSDAAKTQKTLQVLRRNTKGSNKNN